MNKLKKIILYFLNIPLFWISTVIPKHKNIWIFGAWMGQRYSDNSKYLFEYVSQHCPEIRAVWLTQSRDVLHRVRKKGYEAYLFYSLKSILTAMRCRVAVITHAKNDDLIPFISSRRSKLIQLFHGIPLKKVNYDDKIFTFPANEKALGYRLKQIIKKIVFPFLYEEYSLVIATSKKISQTFVSAFRTSPERIKMCGFPRNDAFFYKKEKLLTEYDDINNIGIYMPTFRGDIGNDVDLFTDYGFNVEEMELFLKERRIFLLLKPHPVNRPPAAVENQIRFSKHMQFLEVDDIYSYMNQIDFLITDYSSVYFDYLLLDRPILFAPFDLDDYLKRDRELYYPYEEVTPGPIAKNWSEVMKYIDEAIKYPDKYREQRQKIRDLFYQHVDGKSSERVVDAIFRAIS